MLLQKTQYTSSHPYLTGCPQRGNLHLKLETGLLSLFRCTLMRFLTQLGWSAQCPVITINSDETRNLLSRGWKQVLFTLGMFSLSPQALKVIIFPIREQWLQRNAVLVKPKGTRVALTRNTSHNAERPPGMLHCQGMGGRRNQNREPGCQHSTGGDAAAIWTNAFENLLLGRNGQVLMDVMNQDSQGSQRESSAISWITENLSKENTLEKKPSGAIQCGRGKGLKIQCGPWNEGLVVSPLVLEGGIWCLSSTETWGGWLAPNRSFPPTLGTCLGFGQQFTNMDAWRQSMESKGQPGLCPHTDPYPFPTCVHVTLPISSCLWAFNWHLLPLLLLG